MTRLCLIRHGQTDWNLEGRYQGQSDVALNATGRAQARALSQILKHQPFAALYASDLIRARETAEIIGEILSLPVQLEPGLREIHQGEWEGQLSETIIARYEGLFRERLLDPAHTRPPGGETVAEVAARVWAVLDAIARQHPADSVIIVSHGLALATAICKTQNIEVGQAYQHLPKNAQPRWVTWDLSTVKG